MNIDLDKIGNFLFEQRNKKGLTQEQLASQIGASFKTVSKWENGGSFPDVSYQLLLCNALGITLKELQMGCLDIEERSKRKIIHIFTRFSIIFIIITIPILCFLLVYFASHVGKPKIYQVKNVALSAKIGLVEGMLIKSYKYNYLSINSVKLYNYDENELNTISMNLYSDNNILYHSNDMESFIIRFDDSFNIDYNKLKLVISVYNSEQKNNYEFYLDINNSIKSVNIINNTTKDFSKYDLLNKLNDNNFKNVVGDVWNKKIITDKYNINVNIYTDTYRIMYDKKTDTTIAKLLYYKDYNVLEAVIYSNQIFNTIIEKYNYNYANDELECKVGLCASYQKAIADIEEYVSLLNGE